MEDRRKAGRQAGMQRNEGSRVNARMKEGSNNKHKYYLCTYACISTCTHIHTYLYVMYIYMYAYVYIRLVMMTGTMGISGVVVT